jgi:hypothetical protein
MLRHSEMLAVLSVALLAHAGAAYGASTQAEDPPAGSPAGAIYELPLERGRAEAAPKGGGGTTATSDSDADGDGKAGAGTERAGAGEESPSPAGDEGASEEASLYRSENNFGSSSQVPGAPPDGGGDASTGSDRSDGGATIDVAQGRAAAEAADSGNTSPAANIALLGAIALIALGCGVLVRRSGRLTTGR